MFPGVAGFVVRRCVRDALSWRYARCFCTRFHMKRKGVVMGMDWTGCRSPSAVVWARVVLEARGCLAVSGQKDPARTTKNGRAALDQPMALKWPKKERILMGRTENRTHTDAVFAARAVGPSPICPAKIPVAGGASLSHAFEDRSDALAGANAHGYQRTLAAGALQIRARP